jgi:hypothetical protein
MPEIVVLRQAAFLGDFSLKPSFVARPTVANPRVTDCSAANATTLREGILPLVSRSVAETVQLFA